MALFLDILDKLSQNFRQSYQFGHFVGTLERHRNYYETHKNKITLRGIIVEKATAKTRYPRVILKNSESNQQLKMVIREKVFGS